jgi:uncharacterized membrane protein YqjE
LRRAATAASSLLLARAEFAAVELTQAGADALRWLLAALAATALLTLTLVAVTATIVMALWERAGWYSMGILALIYVGATGFVVHRLRRTLHARRPVLEQTLAELAKDREALFGRAPDAGPVQRP